jgi:hypothetical protein
MVSSAIIDALTSGTAAAGSDSVLLCADLIQRAGKHAMLLFVYVVPLRRTCRSSLCCRLSDLAASLATADSALRIMIVSAVQTGLQAIGLQVCALAPIAVYRAYPPGTSQSLNALDRR